MLFNLLNIQGQDVRPAVLRPFWFLRWQVQKPGLQALPELQKPVREQVLFWK